MVWERDTGICTCGIRPAFRIIFIINIIINLINGLSLPHLYWYLLVFWVLFVLCRQCGQCYSRNAPVSSSLRIWWWWRPQASKWNPWRFESVGCLHWHHRDSFRLHCNGLEYPTGPTCAREELHVGCHGIFDAGERYFSILGRHNNREDHLGTRCQHMSNISWGCCACQSVFSSQIIAVERRCIFGGVFCRVLLFGLARRYPPPQSPWGAGDYSSIRLLGII